VVHREAKTGFGLGDKTCFPSPGRGRHGSVSAWVYGLLILLGYQTYGLPAPPSRSAAWERHSRRWSLQTILDHCRLELSTALSFAPFIADPPMTGPKWRLRCAISTLPAVFPLQLGPAKGPNSSAGG